MTLLVLIGIALCDNVAPRGLGEIPADLKFIFLPQNLFSSFVVN